MSTQLALIPNTPLDAQNTPLSLNQAAAHYRGIKDQIEALEQALKPLKQQLEEAALSSPEMKLELDTFKITLSECSRENFDLKTAKVKLGEDICGPFIKVTNYTMLLVREK